MALDIDQIKRDHPILAVIGSRVELHQRGACFWACCPLHGEKTASFKVDPDKGFYHCFGCGASGDQIAFVRAFEHCDFAEAVDILTGQRAGSEVARPHVQPSEPVTTSAAKIDHFSRLRPGLQRLAGTPGAEYLLRRGIDPQFAASAGVRFHPSVFGRPAIVFPLIDGYGVLVAMQARHTDAGTPRMHTIVRDPNQTGSHGGVFVTPRALSRRRLTITEGPIDALSLGSCQVPSLAVCGASNRPGWLRDYIQPGGVICIAFDTDNAGETNAQLLCEFLRKTGVRIYRLAPSLTGIDWNDALVRNRRKFSYELHQNLAPLFTEKLPVRDADGHTGKLLVAFPPEDDLPVGWVKIKLDTGEKAVLDAAEISDPSGQPVRYAWW